jgi:hypothetical protein
MRGVDTPRSALLDAGVAFDNVNQPSAGSAGLRGLLQWAGGADGQAASLLQQVASLMDQLTPLVARLKALYGGQAGGVTPGNTPAAALPLPSTASPKAVAVNGGFISAEPPSFAAPSAAAALPMGPPSGVPHVSADPPSFSLSPSGSAAAALPLDTPTAGAGSTTPHVSADPPAWSGPSSAAALPFTPAGGSIAPHVSADPPAWSGPSSAAALPFGPSGASVSANPPFVDATTPAVGRRLQQWNLGDLVNGDWNSFGWVRLRCRIAGRRQLGGVQRAPAATTRQRPGVACQQALMPPGPPLTMHRASALPGACRNWQPTTPAPVPAPAPAPVPAPAPTPTSSGAVPSGELKAALDRTNLYRVR